MALFSNKAVTLAGEPKNDRRKAGKPTSEWEIWTVKEEREKGSGTLPKNLHYPRLSGAQKQDAPEGKKPGAYETLRKTSRHLREAFWRRREDLRFDSAPPPQSGELEEQGRKQGESKGDLVKRRTRFPSGQTETKSCESQAKGTEARRDPTAESKENPSARTEQKGRF